MRAILYARSSPRPKADRPTADGRPRVDAELSVDLQLARCREYCQTQEIEVLAAYEDVGVSGDDPDREGLWNAIAALRKGDVLLVYSLDRLARSVYLMYHLEQAIAKHKGRLVTVLQQGNGASAEDKLVRGILMLLAEYQKKITAARTKHRMLQHQASGRRMGSRCPFGWTADPGNPALMVEEPEEQRLIGVIRNMAVARHGARAISRALNEEGVQCRGGVWHHTTVRHVLRRAGETL